MAKQQGRPNRGVGSAGPKKPGNPGGRNQYSAGGSSSSKKTK